MSWYTFRRSVKVPSSGPTTIMPSTTRRSSTNKCRSPTGCASTHPMYNGATETIQNFTPPMLTISSDRSEEHTSELQSRGHLVCRLLLEKKKKKNQNNTNKQKINEKTEK